MYFAFFIAAALCCTRISCQQTLIGRLAELEANNTNLQKEIISLKERVTVSSAYCSLHASGKCGQCVCIDDFDLPQKYYCDCQNLTPQRDCLAFYQNGNRVNGIYKVTLNGVKNMQVHCDQNSKGGGWTTIQRRMDGSTNFYRNWTEYKIGFGKLHREFWLGNENIYLLIAQTYLPKGSEAMIEMRQFGGSINYYNRYGHFHVNNEAHKYSLHVANSSGDFKSSHFVSYSSNMKFTTYDNDNDKSFRSNCAQNSYGGWWYKDCSEGYTNLNGLYVAKGLSWIKRFNWDRARLEFSEIKIRRLV